jgi:hypothetical protein
MIIGSLLIISGIVLYALSDNEGDIKWQTKRYYIHAYYCLVYL